MSNIPKPPRVQMDGEKATYKIEAWDDRFVLLWRPCNLRKTYTYSIVDLDQGVRGPHSATIRSRCGSPP